MEILFVIALALFIWLEYIKTQEHRELVNKFIQTQYVERITVRLLEQLAKKQMIMTPLDLLQCGMKPDDIDTVFETGNFYGYDIADWFDLVEVQ